MPKYTTIDDFIRDANIICDRITSQVSTEASSELSSVINHKWTFASEALGEIGNALKQARPIILQNMSKSDLAFLDEIIQSARELFENPG
jgi:hypothetical protein